MNKQFHRRVQDNIASKHPSHVMNLDRRFKMNERRDMSASNDYNGPARRFLIDRRLTIEDRRHIKKHKE